MIEHVRRELQISERRACAALGQHRSTQRKTPQGRDDEQRLTADIVELARQYGRYGYRKIAELLRTTAGWVVNDKRVERVWRREGLKVPAKQPKRGRLWLADGSCIRLRPEHRNHVWSYDFVEDRTHDGRKYRMLNVIDEFTHECLAIRVARRLKAIDVINKSLITFTFNVVSQGLYIRHGLFPRLPLYFIGGTRDALVSRLQGDKLRRTPIEPNCERGKKRSPSNGNGCMTR